MAEAGSDVAEVPSSSMTVVSAVLVITSGSWPSGMASRSANSKLTPAEAPGGISGSLVEVKISCTPVTSAGSTLAGRVGSFGAFATGPSTHSPVELS